MNDIGRYIDGYIRDVIDTLREKNERYGNSIISPVHIFPTSPGTNSVYTRLNDKFARLANQVTGEDEDVVKDIVGYLCFLVYLLKCEKDEKEPSDKDAFIFFDEYIVSNISGAVYYMGLIDTLKKRIDIFTDVDVIPLLLIKGCSEDNKDLIRLDSFINFILRLISYWDVRDEDVSMRITNVLDLIEALIYREYLINKKGLKIVDAM